ncbi:hypothetical protein Salat_0174800 [Sesamum alatum]|uniref:Uncharacterized protein n=1 Tax=Sesamum alatum TaxID=300844 RepID=A0AAE1YX49_9LAMI|nr:hypothetical protein Salat_0174800 [Sesamum alatum]
MSPGFLSQDQIYHFLCKSLILTEVLICFRSHKLLHVLCFSAVYMHSSQRLSCDQLQKQLDVQIVLRIAESRYDLSVQRTSMRCAANGIQKHRRSGNIKPLEKVLCLRTLRFQNIGYLKVFSSKGPNLEKCFSFHTGVGPE